MIELDKDTFAEMIKGEQPVAVDFWAEWCMPCKIFSPVLEELSDELDGKVTFCKLNIDDYSDLAVEYAIASIPTVLLFKNGEVAERLVGVLPKDHVRESIEKNL